MKEWIERTRGAAPRLLVAAALFFAAACEEGTLGPRTGSETHFLTRCTDRCADGFDCVCGVCTAPCSVGSESNVCSSYASIAECTASADPACAPAVSGICDAACRSDADCGPLGPFHVCDAGQCRAGQRSPAPTAGAGGGSGLGATGGTAGMTATGGADCTAAPVSPDELLVIGDSLIELSGMTGYLEELARAAGALGAAENYRDASSSLNSFLAQNAFSLSGQYESAVASGVAKVVLMNGGATDMMQDGCDPPSASCAAILDAETGARNVLSSMASDGVETVVYFFYANMVDNPALTARIDLLRPRVQAACDGAPMTCHFVDLRPVFEGHYADYVGPDGIVFSAEGAKAVARVLWNEMRAMCIAP